MQGLCEALKNKGLEIMRGQLYTKHSEKEFDLVPVENRTKNCISAGLNCNLSTRFKRLKQSVRNGNKKATVIRDQCGKTFKEKVAPGGHIVLKTCGGGLYPLRPTIYQPPDRSIDYPEEWRGLNRTWSRPAAMASEP